MENQWELVGNTIFDVVKSKRFLNIVKLCLLTFRGGQSGGAGGAQATPGILIFQKQVTLFTKSGDSLELE